MPLRASQVPRPIFPRALPPPTPKSPTIAPARCFIAGSRLHHSLADWPLLLCVTRPKRVRLRCGSRVRLARLRQCNYFHSRLLGYLSNGQFTRYPPFRILDRPGLSWRSKGAKTLSNGRCPSSRADARDLKKISPFGRIDILFLPLRLCAFAGEMPISYFAPFAFFAANSSSSLTVTPAARRLRGTARAE